MPVDNYLTRESFDHCSLYDETSIIKIKLINSVSYAQLISALYAPHF